MASRSPSSSRSSGESARVQRARAIIDRHSSLPYKTTKLDFSKNAQKEPWFLEINPNGRIPALTDKFTDGKPIRIFESGSIMQYLVARYDKDHKLSFPAGSREDIEVCAAVAALTRLLC